jgi:hypothetical protein
LEVEATGDRARAENWFKKYDGNVPVDIEPVFSFAREVK